MIGLLKKGMRIINIDESWVNQTNYSRRIWAPADSPASATVKQITHNLNLIAALDTDGNVWFSVNHSNTNHLVIQTFISNLVRQMDRELGDWRENTILLHDNATYFCCPEVTELLKKLGVKTMLSAPYSYNAAPIELVFGNLKMGELCKIGQATGKK